VTLGAATKASLFDQLEAHVGEFTPAERQIANHLLIHRDSIPFENAATLARKLGVSAVTVGRFCRAMGFRHFRDLKEDMRTRSPVAPWLAGDRLREFRETYENRDELRRSLDLEIGSLVEVYGMIDTPNWNASVKLLAHSAVVQIIGFQTERGLALLLANSLNYLREGIELVDPASGHYADVFSRRSAKRCLVLIDNRRYSRQTYLLAEQAADAKLPLIMITDKKCDWARQFTPHVISVSTDAGQFWSSSVAMACVVNQLANCVVARSGAHVEKRLRCVSTLYDRFTGFVESGPRRGHTGRSP
jgi:DNA-binding MurR/RpiR family transcriptional regulator